MINWLAFQRIIASVTVQYECLARSHSQPFRTHARMHAHCTERTHINKSLVTLLYTVDKCATNFDNECPSFYTLIWPLSRVISSQHAAPMPLMMSDKISLLANMISETITRMHAHSFFPPSAVTVYFVHFTSARFYLFGRLEMKTYLNGAQCEAHFMNKRFKSTKKNTDYICCIL